MVGLSTRGDRLEESFKQFEAEYRILISMADLPEEVKRMVSETHRGAENMYLEGKTRFGERLK